MKFTVEFDVPDGTTIRINPTPASAEAQFVAPFEDELIPLPDGAMPIPGDVTPFRGMAQNPPPNNGCPVHHVPWKMVPAGISKKTGKPYSAFAVCSVQGCDQRPPQ